MFRGQKPETLHRFGNIRARGRVGLPAFLDAEDGVATVDWVVIAAGLTALGLMTLSFGQEGLGTFTANVRDEVQSPYFKTSWTDSLPLNQ